MHVCKVITWIIVSWIYIISSACSMPAKAADGIVVNLPSMTIEYYVNRQCIKKYPVAIGKPATPTPLGEYSIINKEVNPWWYPPENPSHFITSGPSNPLGYRWMGFAGNYGIHGTNAPWSIGSAVSNGCIRMYEEDVEELFAIVPYETPVQVTYDRIKLFREDDGWLSMKLYPDVYGYKEANLSDVKTLLSEAGLGGWVEDKVLRQFLNEDGVALRLGQVYNIEINKQILQEKAVWFDESFYIPTGVFAAGFKKPIFWNAESQTVNINGHTAKGLVKGQNFYVAAGEVNKIFGCRQRIDRSNFTLELVFPQLLFEGRLVTKTLQKDANSLAVPVLAVAREIGQRVTWDNESKVLKLGCKKIAVELWENEPYIQAEQLTEYFNAAVEWDEDEQCAQLQYPVHPIDYSMYIELMADFTD